MILGYRLRFHWISESTNYSLAFSVLSRSDPSFPDQLQSTLWTMSPASALGAGLSKCHLQSQRTFRVLTCNLAERTGRIMHSIVLYCKGQEQTGAEVELIRADSEGHGNMRGVHSPTDSLMLYSLMRYDESKWAHLHWNHNTWQRRM